MKCLIIAAGQGTRLSKRGDSKPLISLLGLSLIERAILTAKRCGLSDFYVVTGYNGQKVRSFLDRFGKHKNIKITHLINEEWEKGNGLSVLKAKHLLDKNFILLMVDHLFDEKILEELQSQQIDGGEVILAVDYNINSNPLVDMGDVTKVYVEDKGIVDIGKDIHKYSAYDTGAFLCSPVIFTAIERSTARNNDSSLSGAIKILAEEKKAKAFDIRNKFWLDLDDEDTLKKAEKYMLGRLKKLSDGPVSRYINRPISTKITKHLLRTNITPNQISFVSFLVSLIASALLFLGNYIGLLLSGILVQVSSIIDGCDGEVARLKYKETDFGKWFDACLDRYADAFILFGLSYYAFSSGSGLIAWPVGFLAIIGSFMNSYMADKYDGLMKAKFSRGKPFRIRIGRDVRMFIIFIGAVINQAFFVLVFIAVLMNIENIRRVIVCYRDESH